ncbi:putative inorganic phosphate cotransporter [Achroia grisella]|uniref:putative inorganic phosphate cotransporter n=1 Tax=Achroia grisella TaxID=688607 RepID=UPI0027D1FBA1|nr:putative inorganic phosphate cotransporter [Achroia grisella]
MSTKEKMAEDLNSSKPGIGIRHLQTVLMFFGVLLAYCMRVNMSMAIVAMTDGSENSFDWSMQVQSVILSSFFWGYVVLQVPSGEMAARFGGKVLLCLCVGLNSATSLCIPIAAYYGGWQMVCACRVIQGLSQGFIYPSLHTLIGKWVPLEEKTTLGSFIYAGGHLGTALELSAAGFIAEYWGWPAIFYVIGTLGVIWTTIYIFIGASSPQESRLISDTERKYIEHSLGHVVGQKKLSTPWKSLFTSMSFISLIIVHCGQNWGFWTLMTEIPSYMNQVLGVNMKSNGLMSALPYLSMFLLSFPFGFISNYVISKNWLSVTATRKISNSIGLFGPALTLIALCYTPADVTVTVVMLTLVVGLNAGHIMGFMLVHIDMAPNFAGTMMGITNAAANIVSIIAPLAAGVILNDETDPKEWHKVFYLASIIYVISNIVFLIFGSAEVQTWNDPKSENKNTTEEAFGNVEKVI